MPNVLKIILYGVPLIVFGLILVSYLTGHDGRGYKTTPGSKSVDLQGEEWRVSELARRYQPIMLLRESTPSPPLSWVWYEAIDNPSYLDFVYYLAWENEIHPNPPIHILYSFFRAIYYGFPLYDVEYVQVRVDKDQGKILKLRFETSPVDDYFVTISEHHTLELELDADGRYLYIQSSPEGDTVVEKSGYSLNVEADRAVLGVQTWNHLSTLVNPDQYEEYAIRANDDLRELSEEEYKKNKFVRKSQSDYSTSETPLTAIFAYLTYALFILVPALALRAFGGSRRNGENDTSNA